MTLQLRLHDDALRELDDTVDYYEHESPGLGSVFVDEVEAGFARIREHPFAAPEIAPNVHQLALARFPHTIFYEVRSDFIRILAIAPQRRRPFYWGGRR